MSFSNFDLIDFILPLPIILIALTIHEFSHGFAAYKLGDTTAKTDGRLSLNPLRHIDLIGLLFLIVARFGWAKPVMVNPINLKNPKRDMAIISFCGPLSNFLLAFVFLLIIFPVWRFLPRAEENILPYYARYFIEAFLAINIGLGVFNLIPIPPLDGSKVFAALLPNSVYQKVMSVNHNIMLLIVMALAYTGMLSKLISPIIDALINAFLKIVESLYFFI
jgi:Zn-dependent protease